MNMLANPGNQGNQNPNNGIYTVSLNPSIPSLNILPRQVVTPVTPAPVRSTEVKHQCQHCHKTFSSRYNVARHDKICKLNGNNLAPQQQQQQQQIQQQQQQQQQQQLQTNPPQKEAKTFHCLFCYKSFSTSEAAARHLKKCNKPQQTPPTPAKALVYSSHSKKVHICKYCAKEFSTKWNVIRHEKLFHNPNDPVVVSQPITNGILMTQQPVPFGKPERYCRFCGNYFSSKYNAIRHEKICTRINSNNNNVQQQEQQQQQIQQKSIQVSAVTTPVMTLAPVVQQQQQVQQQPQQQQTQQVQQQVQQQQISSVQQQVFMNNNKQVNIQNNQQLLPQQTMVLIEPHPSTPFHVCKFCNKQMATRCDPVAPVAISGQHMLGGTQLITPVMASIPQLALLPQIGDSSLQQSHQIVQHQIQQQEKPQQQIVQQHQCNIPQQQHIQQTQQQRQQQQLQQQQQVERAHCCKYCEKRFATKWYLDQHEKIHTGEADMCKQCGKYFVTRWHLDKHMKVHMQGVTPGGSPSNKKAKKDQQSSTLTLPNNQTFRFAQQPSSGVTTTTDIRQIAPLMSMAVTCEAEHQEQRSTRPVSAPYILTSDRGYFVPSGELPPVNQTIAPPPSSQETSKGEIPTNITTYTMS